jgi:hypothetical protein
MPGKANKPSFDGKLERATFFGHSPNLPRIVEVELKNLRPNPEQPRTDFNAASIQDLAASIQQHGMIQPIAVMKDHSIRTTQPNFSLSLASAGTALGSCSDVRRCRQSLLLAIRRRSP